MFFVTSPFENNILLLKGRRSNMRAIFLGGDLRQKYACDYLNIYNINSEFYPNFDLNQDMKNSIQNASLIALPIPICKADKYLNISGENFIDIYEILSLLNKNNVVFGGNFTGNAKDYLDNKGIHYIDYFEIESFQIRNALLSAEGAIYYAKQRLDISITGLDIAILGFGRIGKILAYLLSSQGAKITVCCRKESDLAWCKLMGFNAIRIKNWGNRSNLELSDDNYDVIFNTIPYRIMDESFAKKYNGNTLILDLASYPFGMDEFIAEKYKLKYYREPGIPGRYAPKSAGEIIGETIINNLNYKEE